MPKLYYTPTSCGVSSFIAAFVGNVKIETEQIEFAPDHVRRWTQVGKVDLYNINSKGNVPTFVLDDGTVLNENIASLQYIADLAGPGVLAPAHGTQERYVLENVLSYLCSEAQPAIGGLFNPTHHEEVKKHLRDLSAKKLAYLESTLIGNKTYLVGDSFTIADSYLYVILTWTNYVGIDLTPYPVVKAYLERIGNLPAVKAAHARVATQPVTSI